MSTQEILIANCKTRKIRRAGSRSSGGDQVPYGSEWTTASRPHCCRTPAPQYGRTNPIGWSDPKHALHEHPVVAPGGPFLVRPTYNQGRHPLPSHVVQNQTIHHTQSRLPKRSL